jgi:DNA-binding NtrC family response regulator
MRLLVVDDDDVMRKLLGEVLEKDGHSVALASSGEEAVARLRRETFPIILSDIRMVEMDGMAVLREAKKAGHGSAVILMTGFGSMEGAVRAIQEGAFDYVSKPFKMDELKALVARAAKHWESLTSRPAAATHAPDRRDFASRALIGKSPRIVEVYKALARAALSTSSVLVTGESGTGKELVARAIHENGPRRSGRFVALGCGGAAAEGQLEAELRQSFVEADGGTLFIDEVGDLPPTLQARLLRGMQEGEIREAGSPGARKVDVRVVAATHRDLEALVRAGRFREDLYYRLKVISIELPPLRERREDLPELVGFFLARYAERNRKRVSHVSDEAMARLRAYSWPGNIRELEHSIERAVAMANTEVLFPEDFPLGAPDSEGAEGAASASSLEEMERAHIVKVLNDVGFNKSRASEVLGIDRATLYRKAQRYGIDLRGK